MSALAATVLAVLVALAFLGLIAVMRSRLSQNLTVRISNETTRVLDDNGNCIVELPTLIRYTTQAGTARVVAFGEDEVDRGPAEDSVELALSTRPSDAPSELRDSWGAYITYCCEKARRALGIGQWRPLRVSVAAETSEPEANEHFRIQASHKSLRWIGHVSPADST